MKVKKNFNMENEIFQEWELVEVSIDGLKWRKRIFLMKSKNGKVLCVTDGTSTDYKELYDFQINTWYYVRKATKEITITVTEEQEEKLKELWIIK